MENCLQGRLLAKLTLHFYWLGMTHDFGLLLSSDNVDGSFLPGSNGDTGSTPPLGIALRHLSRGLAGWFDGRRLLVFITVFEPNGNSDLYWLPGLLGLLVLRLLIHHVVYHPDTIESRRVGSDGRHPVMKNPLILEELLLPLHEIILKTHVLIRQS